MEFRYETFNHCSSFSSYPNGLSRDESLLLFSLTPKPLSWANFPLTPEIVYLSLEIVPLPTVPMQLILQLLYVATQLIYVATQLIYPSPELVGRSLPLLDLRISCTEPVQFFFFGASILLRALILSFRLCKLVFQCLVCRRVRPRCDQFLIQISLEIVWKLLRKSKQNIFPSNTVIHIDDPFASCTIVECAVVDDVD